MVGGGKDREEMNDEHVEKIIMVIEHRKQIVNAMRKIIKMLEVVRNEQSSFSYGYAKELLQL